MKYLHTIVILLAWSFSCHGSDKDNDYYSNSYEERKVNFKIKPGLVLPRTSEQQELPSPSSTAARINTQIILPLLQYGGGIEGAATVFFTEYFASELSFGLQVYQSKLAALKSIGYNYSDNPTYGTLKEVYSFPATSTLQFHLAPLGGIRPYIGGGLVGLMNYTSSTDFDLSNTWGGALQVGVDFCFRDESILGLEVKYYVAADPAVRYEAIMLGTELTGKLRLNSTVISINFGVTF